MLRCFSRGLAAVFLTAAFATGALANPNTTPNADPLGELLHILNAKADGLRNDVVVHAMSMVGVLYRRGGNNEETGFDCSGLVKFVFGQAAALALPRTSREQSDQGTAVQTADLQPGDLVFYNTLKRPFSHVGIYVGQGQFVHSPRTGAKVRLERMSDAYWTRRFEGARRLLGEGS